MASTVVGIGTIDLTGTFGPGDIITSDPAGGNTNLIMGSVLNGVVVSWPRFLWTPICPKRDRNDGVQHDEDRRERSR